MEKLYDDELKKKKNKIIKFNFVSKFDVCHW